MYSCHICLCLDYMSLKTEENSVSFACSVDTDSLCMPEPRKLPEKICAIGNNRVSSLH